MAYQFSSAQLEWLEALRSGKYQQGTSYLARRTFDSDVKKYCCLGVACELEPSLAREEGDLGDGSAFETRYDECGSVLPTKIQGKLNIDPSGRFSKTYVEGKKRISSLAAMNDSGLFTFNQIADFIEQNANLIFINAQ